MGGRVASPTFVGRIEELQALEAARRRAADGAPAVVLVGGEAGVGKTRLVAELTDRWVADGIRVLAGGCVPVGDGGLAYAPIAEALRDLTSEDGVAAVRELVGPSWAELARILPALGEPPSSLPPGPAAQLRLFELLLRLLGRLSDQTPVVLVVEDLHWADQSTRDLLVFLVRNLRRERLLLIATYRDDEPGQSRLGGYLAELDRGGPVQRLELPRLDRAETAAQLTGILGTAPAVDLVDGLFARSEGNPFFTEELLERVRAGSATLPTTLRDLLQGRIEALPEPAQQALRAAAVAGGHVPHRLLAAVAGLDKAQLDGALRAAVAHQLLTNHEDGYQFRHALLREVVDAGLLAGERARLHAAYAHALTEWPELSAGSPAAAAAELAIHWDAAGELDRALLARAQAGLAAEQAHAFPEAQRHYERALQLWERVPDPGQPAGLDQVDFLIRTADAAAFTGAVKRAVGLLEDALARVDPAIEPVRAAVLLARLGDRRHVAGDEAGGLAAFEEAEQLLDGAPPSAERARVLAGHAYALGVSLRYKEAIPYFEEAIACARAVDARVEEGTLLRMLAIGRGMVGQPDRAIALALEARRIAEAIGDVENVIGTYVAVTLVLGWVGRDRDALEEAQQGYQRARELGLERATGSLVANSLAFSLLHTGRWAACEWLTGELLAVTDGTPSSCTIQGARCLPGRASSRPRGSSLIWRDDSALCSTATSRGWRSASSPSGRAATTRGPRRSPRGCASGRSGTLKGRTRLCRAPGTRSPSGSRATGPNMRQPGEQSRRWPRPDGGPPRSLSSWTGSLPHRAPRPATPLSPPTCSSPEPSSPGWKANPTQIGGGRWPPPGSSWSARSRPPTGASGRPRHCSPKVRPADKPNPFSEQPTRRRWRSGPCHYAASSSCLPSAVASN